MGKKMKYTDFNICNVELWLNIIGVVRESSGGKSSGRNQGSWGGWGGGGGLQWHRMREAAVARVIRVLERYENCSDTNLPAGFGLTAWQLCIYIVLSLDVTIQMQNDCWTMSFVWIMCKQERWKNRTRAKRILNNCFLCQSINANNKK